MVEKLWRADAIWFVFFENVLWSELVVSLPYRFLHLVADSMLHKCRRYGYLPIKVTEKNGSLIFTLNEQDLDFASMELISHR